MARFTNGWCQFPRKALVVTRRDNVLKSLLVTLCGWAAVEYDTDCPKVLPGQVLTSDEELAAELNVDRKTISRKLKILAENGIVSLDRDGKRGRIISMTHLMKASPTEIPTPAPPEMTHQKYGKIVPFVPRSCPENAPSQILERVSVQENRVPKMSQSCPELGPHIEEREKEKEIIKKIKNTRAHARVRVEEGEREREESAPEVAEGNDLFFKNSLGEGEEVEKTQVQLIDAEIEALLSKEDMSPNDYERVKTLIALKERTVAYQNRKNPPPEPSIGKVIVREPDGGKNGLKRAFL